MKKMIIVLMFVPVMLISAPPGSNSSINKVRADFMSQKEDAQKKYDDELSHVNHGLSASSFPGPMKIISDQTVELNVAIGDYLYFERMSYPPGNDIDARRKKAQDAKKHY